MLQDIGSHVFYNQFGHPLPRETDRVLAFAGRAVLLTAEGEVPTVETVCALGGSTAALIYLFAVDETRYFLLQPSPACVAAALHPLEGPALRTMQPPEARMAAVTGLHLAEWYRDNRYCGRCGAANRPDEAERAMRCPACGAVVYPRINPAVLAAVRSGGRLLLTRYADRPAANRYALVAGFVEIGETMEQTVCREVMEEVGLRVKNVRYHQSQPWGFVGNLMVGFWADLDGDDDTIRLDTGELSEAVWLRREEIPPAVGDPIALTQTMIELFRRGQDPR